MGVLDEIVAGVREDLAERRARRSLDELAAVVAGMGTTRDPMPAFRAADCLVLPSAYEANALVVLEALAAGLPQFFWKVRHQSRRFPFTVGSSNVFSTACAAVQAAEAEKLLTGAEPALWGRLLMADLDSMETHVVSFCTFCG
mgnify:CR=1 FL=1